MNNNKLICDCTIDSDVVLALMQKLLSCKMNRVKGNEQVTFKRVPEINATLANDSQGNTVGFILNNDSEYDVSFNYVFTDIKEMKDGRVQFFIEQEHNYTIEEVCDIVMQKVNELSAQLLENGIDIRVTNDALIELAKAAYDPHMSDNKVPHIINEYIVNDLSYDLHNSPLGECTDHPIIIDAKIIEGSSIFFFLKSELPKRTK